MELSLQELKNILLAKEGYSISPNHRHLIDPKTLLNDMLQIRSSSEVTCVGHSGTAYTGELSLGDIHDVGKNVKPCTCNTNIDKTCNCVSRSGAAVCTCNSRTLICDCVSRTGANVCTCNSRTLSCNCVSRTGVNVCTCNSRTLICNCVSRTGVNACTCNSRTLSCNCVSRTATVGCQCYYRTEICDCVSRTSAPTCSGLAYVCTCRVRTGTCSYLSIN